jgi:hypothetical protein
MSIDVTSNNDALAAEVAALRHDIERHVQIAADQAQEIEALRHDLAAAQRAYEITRQDCWNLTEKVIPNIRQDLAAARANLEIAERALLAHGYRKSCDIPACNCGDQWHHGGNAVARLVEIRDAISERESFKNNGKTILQCVKECVRSDIDLTEARALLLEAHGWLDPWESRQSALRDRIDAALAAEPTQEPVAWQLVSHKGLKESWIRMNPPIDDIEEWRPLYPAPPQTPMTGEQISQLWSDVTQEWNTVFDFARAVERHHGIGPARGG